MQYTAAKGGSWMNKVCNILTQPSWNGDRDLAPEEVVFWGPVDVACQPGWTAREIERVDLIWKHTCPCHRQLLSDQPIEESEIDQENAKRNCPVDWTMWPLHLKLKHYRSLEDLLDINFESKFWLWLSWWWSWLCWKWPRTVKLQYVKVYLFQIKKDQQVSLTGVSKQIRC